MAADTDADKAFEQLLAQSSEGDDPDILLRQLLMWRATYERSSDTIEPEWAEEEPWSLQAIKISVKRHQDGKVDPRRDCWKKAYESHNIRELWSCGIYEHRALPYLYVSEAKVFPPKLRPTEHSAGQRVQPGHRMSDDDANPEHAVSGYSFRTCFACAGIFEFVLDNGKSTYVWAGVPPADMAYTAVSYVWGDVSDLIIRCSSCGHLTRFPFSNVEKFVEVMAFVGSDRVAWLDALSIDQGNLQDLNTQLAQMGSIYKHADRVSVFLPHGDKSGYDLLARLALLAKQIMSRPVDFIVPIDQRRDTQPVEEDANFQIDVPAGNDEPERAGHVHEHVAALCSAFIQSFATFRRQKTQLQYWQRAWTFQEWSLAADVDLAVESHSSLKVLTAVKTSIFSAACLICQHCLMGCYGLKIRLNIDNDAMRVLFEDVKDEFPLEDFMLIPVERDPNKYRYQDQLPYYAGCDQLLGIRTRPRQTLAERARARLYIMLTAFDKARKAKFEADLIACWAVMCDLKYDYNRNDAIMPATIKVIKAIRHSGLEIFEFFPSLHDPSIRHEGLPRFFFFAERHFAQNYRIKGYEKAQAGGSERVAMYDSLPLFNGRCDPILHLQLSMCQDFYRFSNGLQRVPMPSLFGRDPLQRVANAIPSKFARVTSTHEAITIWKECLYGWTFDAVISDLGLWFELVVKGLPPAIPSNYNIVQYHIPAQYVNGRTGVIRAWALTPITVPVAKLEVARRVRDGVFALVCSFINDHYVEVAYLTVTDQLCGTLLVRSDEFGEVNLQFDSPHTREVQFSLGQAHGGRSIHETRRLRARVTLQPWLDHLIQGSEKRHRGDLLPPFAVAALSSDQTQRLLWDAEE